MGDTVLDFCAGTLITAVTCLALNRVSISVEEDSHCFHEGQFRLMGYIDWLLANSMAIGRVDMKQALNKICLLRPEPEGSDERISPLGWHNYPNYEPYSGLPERPPLLGVDALAHNIEVVDSKLPATKNGASGKEARLLEDVANGDVCCYYWGDFLLKDTAKFRKLQRGENTRMMSFSNTPCMKKFVMLGHVNCAATYIQSADYTGPGQDHIKANVIYRETAVHTLNAWETYKFIQVEAIR